VPRKTSTRNATVIVHVWRTDSIFVSSLQFAARRSPPVWFMLPAGRYMPEYPAPVRSNMSLLEICRSLSSRRRRFTISPPLSFLLGSTCRDHLADLLLPLEVIGLPLSFFFFRRRRACHREALRSAEDSCSLHFAPSCPELDMSSKLKRGSKHCGRQLPCQSAFLRSALSPCHHMSKACGSPINLHAKKMHVHNALRCGG